MDESLTPDWLSEIDHTGDAGIGVEAPTRADLFERAAWAMFDLLTEMDTVLPQAGEEIRVEGPDEESLLVRWLSELNYRHITEGKLFREFRVKKLQRNSLEAEVKGEKIDPGRHRIHTEIKAVTYHGLEIEETAKGFRVRIIFDL